MEQNVILQNLEYKQSIVHTDPFDNHERQALNFGHTIGHAIESISFDKGQALLHGEAIVLGMIAEAKLSIQYLACSTTVLDLLLQFKNDFFNDLNFDYQIEELIPYLKHDKKNDAEIRFSLLENIGKPKVKVALSIEQILNELA